jgi:hypothetical protein
VPHLLEVVHQYGTSAERIGVVFSSYCFETVFHIERQRVLRKILSPRRM